MSFCYHNFPEYRTWYIQPCLGSSLNSVPAPGCPNSPRVGTGAWYQRSWHQSYSEENKTSCPEVNPSNTHSSGKAPRHSLATAFVHTFSPSLYFRKNKTKNARFTVHTDQTLWAVNRGENSRTKEKISSVPWRSSLTTRWQASTRMWNPCRRSWGRRVFGAETEIHGSEWRISKGEECLTADSALEWRAGGLPSLLSEQRRSEVTVIGVPRCEGFRPRRFKLRGRNSLTKASAVSLLKRRFVLVKKKMQKSRAAKPEASCLTGSPGDSLLLELGGRTWRVQGPGERLCKVGLGPPEPPGLPGSCRPVTPGRRRLRSARQRVSPVQRGGVELWVVSLPWNLPSALPSPRENKIH